MHTHPSSRTHCCILKYLWGPLNYWTPQTIFLFVPFNFWLVLTKLTNSYNTQTLVPTICLSSMTGSQCFHFSRWPHMNIHSWLYRSPLLSISAGGQRIMALMVEHWTLRQKAGVIFQNNTKKGQMEEREREKASKEALKSHLLHVLECLTLDFLCFVSIYVTHTLSPPTPTVLHATLITNVFQAFISSSGGKLHLFFLVESRWPGKQSREDKLEVRKTEKVSFSLLSNRQVNYSKRESDNELSNVK